MALTSQLSVMIVLCRVSLPAFGHLCPSVSQLVLLFVGCHAVLRDSVASLSAVSPTALCTSAALRIVDRVINL